MTAFQPVYRKKLWLRELEINPSSAKGTTRGLLSVITFLQNYISDLQLNPFFRSRTKSGQYFFFFFNRLQWVMQKHCPLKLRNFWSKAFHHSGAFQKLEVYTKLWTLPMIYREEETFACSRYHEACCDLFFIWLKREPTRWVEE